VVLVWAERAGVIAAKEVTAASVTSALKMRAGRDMVTIEPGGSCRSEDLARAVSEPYVLGDRTFHDGMLESDPSGNVFAKRIARRSTQRGT